MMKYFGLAIACLLLTSCATTQAPPTASSPSPSAAPTNPNSNIGKTDETGTVVTVDLPDNPACQRKTTSVKLDTYENCLVEGLTWVQVANVLGYKGNERSRSGSTHIVQWSDGSGGYITATFVDNKLQSKSQIGLK